MNADRVLGKPGQLLGHNVFAYCRNSPIVHSDRMGNSPVAISPLNDDSFWIREIYLLSGDEFASAFNMLKGKIPEDDYLEPSEEAFRNIVMNIPGVSSKQASILSLVYSSVEPFISYNNAWGKSLTSITARSLLSHKGYSYVTIDLVHGPGGAIIRIATYDKNGVMQNQTPAAKPFLSNNLWGVNQLIHYMRENFPNNMIHHESLQTELDKVY